MRLSSSLQDLPTYTKVNSEECDSVTDRSYNSKSSRVLQREAATSSFSKEKSLSASTSISKQWIRASICFSLLLLLFLFMYACSIYFRKSFKHASSKYYVVLDCGSTGTRVYVYQSSPVQYKGDRVLPFSLKSLPESFQKKAISQSGRAYRRMETEPGFHKLVHNDTGLKAAINPLLKWAEKQVPGHAHQNTAIFLYATAGVRRLPKSDSQWLLDKAWSILKNSSFLCRREWVKVITGMEEAYYGWLALNHDKGMLGLSPSKGTFGSLDLGGSSLQVTFEIDKPVNDETGVNLNLGPISHHLSAYSLPGYGLNDAFDKSVFYLLKRLARTGKPVSTADKIELEHPCLQTGYNEEYFCSQCAMVNSEESLLIGGRAVGKGAAGLPIKLIGAPQWDECSALAKQTVSRSEWPDLSPSIDCKLKPCALSDSLLQPRGNFYATSGFFVVFRFFNLTADASLNDVLQRGQEFCAKTWTAARGSVSPQPFIEQYCFRAPYIVSLLRDGLHIEDEDVFIGSGSITWTLGVALLEAGQAFSSRIDKGFRILHTDISPSILLLLLVMSVIGVLFALYCVNNPVTRTWLPQRFYLPLFRRNSAASSARGIPSPFGLPRWIPINTGDGRTKMPLSPTVAGSEHPFATGFGLSGGSIQFGEPSSHPLGFSHSISSGSLLQLPFGDRSRPFWSPNRGQMLQSRRSQSREDLISSIEAHMVKV
ncbi:probable apyrase 7 [Phalaenopsis equestris]|uniref:probable apyrase 7 n=1 Tax=Phalaenopsis equestris TaxID=78828 RepID=UPI0009E36120|nr:probable apyrase 7 [Phalaenopsis equestris]XP_020575489.1 probable apyrase 7 [Phalaenopsis equestris]XP_020575490.1 probable apyrase 7 [Phalaenopsis equestris]XP_020575491.1 probable apyrase 7 [Phalaenopsis equestris]XP_020575492.1 probable apyrase 7 [Phalaenopsis equestris]